MFLKPFEDYNPKYPLRSFMSNLSTKICKHMKRGKVYGYPKSIHIEVTNICNLKCPLCPTGLGTLNRPKGFMTLAQFIKIISEVNKYIICVDIAGYGEPFLNKEIYEIIKYASDHGISVNVYSNGILIDANDKVKRLINSGLRTLTLSLDGSTQKTYEKYRVGGRLGVLLENAKAIIQERKRQGLSYPKINFKMVVTSMNENEVSEARRISETIGADLFFTKPACLAMALEDCSKGIPKNIINSYFPKNIAYQKHKMQANMTYQNECYYLYREPFIAWNGDVLSCCHDSYSSNKMGNFFMSGSFYELWNNYRYMALRTQVNKDISKATPLCNVCPERIIIDKYIDPKL
jgi:MoaA/NifB/PqqE/SkfB family radical SAM enzyme